MGWWGVGVEKDADCGDGEEGAEDEEDGSAKRCAARVVVGTHVSEARRGAPGVVAAVRAEERVMGEPGGDEDGEGGEGGEDVVLLACGEGEEEEDEGGPDEEEDGPAALLGEIVAAELAAEGLGLGGVAEEGRGPGGGFEDEG